MPLVTNLPPATSPQRRPSQPSFIRGRCESLPCVGGKGAAEAIFEKPGDVFNGRIQDVRIAGKVLGANEIDALSAKVAPEAIHASLIADWDFAKGMATDKITDVRGKNHGTVVNLAERAVRGRFWNGDTINWQD